MRALLLSLTAVLPLLLPVRGEAAELRCGRELSSEGTSMAEVLRRCGEPARKEVRTTSAPVKGRIPLRPSVIIEEWTYSSGPRDWVQVVVFENGRLADVRQGDYGK